MLEVYVLVESRKSPLVRFLAYLSLLGAVACLLLSCRYFVFMTVGVIMIFVWYFLQFRQFKEYEYSYFDGECRFARIMNKSRRKRLCVINMDEVMQIAPAGDRSVSNYERDASVKKTDYTSHTKAPYYDLVYKQKDGCRIIQFEPDEAYLDAVCVKYGQKVIRRKEAAPQS